MIATAAACWILVVPVCPPDGPMVVGWLSQYSEAPTVATIDYRQRIGDLPADLGHYDGFIAVADCGRIGASAWLSIEGGALERVAVFDCAGADGSAQWMENNQIIAEVDFYTAERYALEGGAQAVLFWGE